MINLNIDFILFDLTSILFIFGIKLDFTLFIISPVYIKAILYFLEYI